MRPLLLEEETNKYVQYDFSKFNIEHILNDHPDEDRRYSLGNLLLCPDALNEAMKDSSYEKKKRKLQENNIPYLVNFAMKYDHFDERTVEERTAETIIKLKNIYLLSKDSIEKNYNDLDILFGLKRQLIESFGTDSGYVAALEEKGLKKFIE